MEVDLPNVQLAAILPEIVLSAVALFLLVFDAVVGDRIEKRIHLPVITIFGFAMVAALSVLLWIDVADPDVSWFGLEAVGPQLQLAGAAAVDGFSLFLKVTLAVFGILSVLLGREYLRRQDLEESEFYPLMLFAVAGMMLMASATDLIVIFIALETFSLALYVMVGFRRRSLISQESAMKYFLLGSFSSGFFLLGIAIVYGAIGSTNLYSVAGADGAGVVEFLGTSTPGSAGLLVLGAGLLIIGLGFKVAAVPFHMWTPDAYQGAPSPVTGFMAAGSKLAGFAVLLRLLDVTMFPLRDDWRPLLIAIAIATMALGSLFAIVQEDVKRLLAYSSIAHAGFVLTGVIAANDEGISASLFYLATYGLTVIGAFAITAVIGGAEESRTRMTDYKGLFYRRPALAGALSLFLLSLAGVPLTSGFVGKLVVFGAAIEAGYWWLVVVGAVASAVAAFFYLRIIVVMYMQEPDEDAPEIAFGGSSGAVLGATALATIGLGLAWGPLYNAAQNATLFFPN